MNENVSEVGGTTCTRAMWVREPADFQEEKGPCN